MMMLTFSKWCLAFQSLSNEKQSPILKVSLFLKADRVEPILSISGASTLNNYYLKGEKIKDKKIYFDKLEGGYPLAFFLEEIINQTGIKIFWIMLGLKSFMPLDFLLNLINV